MAEKVITGGMKSFHYEKNYNPKLSPEEKQEIREAYEKARERKRVERRKRNIIIAVAIIIILIILAAVFLSITRDTIN